MQYFLYCTDHSAYILVNIPEPVQYKIYTLALPFDLRFESGTLLDIVAVIGDLISLYTVILNERDFKGGQFSCSKSKVRLSSPWLV